MSLCSAQCPVFGDCRASVKYKQGRSKFVPDLRMLGIGGANRIER
jgi:hypothetical protein